MNPHELEYDDLDRLISLSLQKSGKMLPINIEDDFDDENESVELPPALMDVESAVETILEDSAPKICFFENEDKAVNKDSNEAIELPLAARHGSKLSKETLDKIKSLKKGRDID